MSDRVVVPEEAIEKAAIRQAGLATGDEGQWRGYWNYTRAALEVAAPLIVAAELERLAECLPISLGVMDDDDQVDPESMPTYDEGVDDIQRLLRARASVLRGGGDQK